MSSVNKFKKALVLSGGNVKGAFQAGALAEILKFYQPDAIYGISVGTLNGVFLADRAGRAVRAGKKPDWAAIGEELVHFWVTNITKPESIAVKKKAPELALKIMMKKFDGLTDNSPIRKLIYREISMENLKASPVYFAGGCTNLASGEILYADKNYDRFLEYVIASTAIPITMPHVTVQNQPLVDGALRASAPMDLAIQHGADEILAVLCHAEKLNPVQIHMGSLTAQIERIMDVISNEQISNDMKIAEQVNEMLRMGAGNSPQSPLFGKRILSLSAVRPVVYPDIDVDEFTSRDIQDLIRTGRMVAETYAAARVHPAA